MQKIVSIIWLLLLITSTSIAQGINFENASWKAITTKAKKQKKIINLNVCSNWSKQCGVMNNTLQNDTVGNYFNKNFINVNIDVDSEEGKAIIKSYPAAVFPIQTFIHPTTGDVIYSEIGEANATDYVKRGTLALREFNNGLPYDKLYEKFEKGDRDQQFLQEILKYGHQLNKDIDPILNEYVTLFFKNNPSEKDIELLHTYIATIDNIGTIYMYNLALATKDEKFIKEVNNWIADLFTGTYIKAVNTKNVQLIDKIKTMAAKTNHPQVEPIYFYYLQQYFKATNDENKYLDAINKEMAYYLGKSINDYKKEDSIALIGIKEEYKTQLVNYNIAPDQIDNYIHQNIKDNPQALSSISYMAADQINNTLELILSEPTKFKNLLPQIEVWSEKMMELMNGYDNYLAFLSINQAKVLLRNDKAQQAKSLLATSLKTAKDNAALMQKIQELYNSIQ